MAVAVVDFITKLQLNVDSTGSIRNIYGFGYCWQSARCSHFVGVRRKFTIRPRSITDRTLPCEGRGGWFNSTRGYYGFRLDDSECFLF